MKIEVGGGHTVPEDWLNVDPRHGSRPDLCRKIQDGVPSIADNSVDVVRASHVMEHIAAGDDRINALNEVYRILKPGGEFQTITPCVGYTDAETGEPVYAGFQAWSDPTHTSYWFFPESWRYLIRGGLFAHANYGLDLWDMSECTLKDGWEAHVTLLKPMET